MNNIGLWELLMIVLATGLLLGANRLEVTGSLEVGEGIGEPGCALHARSQPDHPLKR